MNTFYTMVSDGAQAAAPVVGMMGGAYPNPTMMQFANPLVGPVAITVLVIGALVLFAFWIWMLVHAIQNEPKDQALWILILMLTNFWGGVIYYFAVKRKMDARINPPYSSKIL
jgi:hypothetical protein